MDAQPTHVNAQPTPVNTHLRALERPTRNRMRQAPNCTLRRMSRVALPPAPGPAWETTDLPGVLRGAAAPIADGRGSFSEQWRQSWTAAPVPGGFVQANVSRSQAGVLRGMHVHFRQWDLWAILAGEAFICLADLRAGEGEATPAPPLLTLEARPGTRLLIPPRVAHGFLARTPFEMLYLVSREYDGTDEAGFRWDDPEAAIPWPAEPQVISDRDRSAGSLADVRLELRGSPS